MVLISIVKEKTVVKIESKIERFFLLFLFIWMFRTILCTSITRRVWKNRTIR